VARSEQVSFFLSTDQQKKRLVKRLADLGYAVELTPLAA
jgi:hypothetical protein